MSVTANEKVVCLLNMGYIYHYVVAAESWMIGMGLPLWTNRT